MFNVTHIAGVVQDSAGAELAALAKQSYGESLGPGEQRSFVYHFTPDATKLAPGDYMLAFSVHYADREKVPFHTLVANQTTTLVPAPPEPMDPAILYAAAAGAAGVALLLALVGMISRRAGGGKKAAAKAPTAKAAPAAAGGDEWLSGTLAGTEGPKKRKGK